MICFDSENAQFEEGEEPREREDFVRPTTIQLFHGVCFLLQTKADVNQIYFSWDLPVQLPSSVVSAYMAVFSPFV